jgi:hypothetical protein
VTSWRTEFEAEIARAQQARVHSNEGQARVCARRAAGSAVREYFQRHSRPVRSSSAYDLLKEIEAEGGLPESAREAARYLTLRVDETFKLPVSVDLVAEACRLAEALLPD